MSSLFETTYNPDVLSCIANLSNDEVFTPPELANKMTYLLSCCNIRLFLVQNSFSSLILILSMIFRNSQQ